MRRYGQYCSIAKALDVVGDRWTLLIIRELLIRGACRVTDRGLEISGDASVLQRLLPEPMAVLRLYGERTDVHDSLHGER